MIKPKRNYKKCILLLTVVTLMVSVATSAAAQPTKLRAAQTNLHHPEVDASAFYMFRSYEIGQADYVTIIANYNPMQAPGGAPHFYPLDEDARYDLHIDSDGDGTEDLTFRFSVANKWNRLGTVAERSDPQTFTQPFLVAPNNLPRQDLVGFYLEGLPGFNQNGSSGEMLRLDTSIPPTPAGQQNNMGFLGADEGGVTDNAGFPNGLRPGDDVIDITWRILQGRLCHPPFDTDYAYCSPGDAPSGLELTTDQVWVEATQFAETFPYLNTPLRGGN